MNFFTNAARLAPQKPHRWPRLLSLEDQGHHPTHRAEARGSTATMQISLLEAERWRTSDRSQGAGGGRKALKLLRRNRTTESLDGWLVQMMYFILGGVCKRPIFQGL